MLNRAAFSELLQVATVPDTELSIYPSVLQPMSVPLRGQDTYGSYIFALILKIKFLHVLDN